MKREIWREEWSDRKLRICFLGETEPLFFWFPVVIREEEERLESREEEERLESREEEERLDRESRE